MPVCVWANASPLLRRYHDHEWGRPARTDARLFERIVLEGAQAGLSWATILAKRPAYRRAFAGFDPARVARFGAADERRLLADPGIVRNRAKVHSAIVNAQAFLALRAEVGSVGRWLAGQGDPGALSRELRRRGFTFVGPTISASILQAIGVLEGHEPGCAFATQARSRRPLAAARATARAARAAPRR